MTPQIVDIGVNLAHRSYQADRDQVIERALEAGVHIMVVTGTSLRNSQEAQKLASFYSGKIYSTAGVHPHDARNCDFETLKLLRKLAGNEEVVAIGECGLDYNRDFSPRPVQDKWFEAQVELACELKMPLFLHERDAHKRFVEILAKYRDKMSAAVVHCFTGDVDELKTYLDMNFHIGITGWICDERRGVHLRDLVRRIPLDKLMIETDAPFLLPGNISPKPKDRRNEPAFLTYVLQMVANCLKKPIEDIAWSTTNTAREFFQIQ
jgi:TatD DNase family protein